MNAKPWTPQPEPSVFELLTGAIADQVAHPVQTAVAGASRVLRTPGQVLRRAADVAGGVGSLVARGMAPPGPFNAPVGAARRFAMAEVPVADAKAVKNALGGTVNDVVLAAVTGALRQVLHGRGERVSGLTLRAMVPVSTRDPSQTMALGNQVSMFFVDLPVGVSDPARRLRTITAATEALKSSHQAVAATALINTAQWAPPTLHSLAARLLTRQRVANLVVSNVPGPQVPLYLAGAQLMVAFPVMPLGENLGLSVAVTSLSGVMGFGFTADWDAARDIEEFPAGLLESFDELKKAAAA